jgi:S1-C subfamily serine protease
MAMTALRSLTSTCGVWRRGSLTGCGWIENGLVDYLTQREDYFRLGKAVCVPQEAMVKCKYQLVICLLNFGFATLGQTPITVTPASQRLTSADVVQKINTSIVRVKATFSYEEQEDPNLTSALRRTPLDLSGPVQECPNQTLTWTSAGTGFIIDSDGHIVTANHVISPRVNQQAAENALKKAGLILGPGSFQRVTITIVVQTPHTEQDAHGNEYYDQEAKVFKQDERLDIAILTCRTNSLKAFSDLIPPRSLPEFQKEAPHSGDSISVSGFPTAGGSDSGIPAMTTITGIVTNSIFKNALGKTFYLADVGVGHGDSGAPVFLNTSGRIIGLVDAHVSSTNGVNPGRIEIIPIPQILDLLPSGAR